MFSEEYQFDSRRGTSQIWQDLLACDSFNYDGLKTDGHILSYFDNTMNITFVWGDFTSMYITEILAD